MSSLAVAVLALASTTLVSAQNTTTGTLNTPAFNGPTYPSNFTKPCGADLLVDDFATPRQWTAPGGEVKYLNALNGDWGVYGVNRTINNAAKTLTLVPGRGATVYPADPKVAPGSEPTFNWFYTQFSNQQAAGAFDKACADLSPFSSFEFDAVAPAGFNFNITFTMRQVGNCSTRIFDSIYQPFTKYYTTPGQKATIKLPFSDFAKDWAGNNVNWAWDKDMTWVNLVAAKPTDSLVISNVWLRGAQCSSSGTPTGPTAGSSSTAGGAGATATKPAGNGAGATSAQMGVVGVAAAFAAAALL
ncbi:hypothetical protein HDV00_011487 [Rhizophlyctis rosea]|nr:hypothetical protein HDV00_011487 [Rhizophlyctis rosea]